MEFSGNGFLSAEAFAENELFIQKHADLLNFFKKVIGHIIQFTSAQTDLDLETEDGKRKAATLMICARLIEISESAYLHFTHRMPNETMTSLRVFLDAYFIFANLCIDADFVKAYFRSDFAQQQKLMIVVQQHDDDLFKLAKEYATQERRQLMRQIIEDESIQELVSYNNACAAGCKALYDSMYRLASAAVHSTPRAIEKYLNHDDTDTITSISFGPNGDVEDHYFVAIISSLIPCLHGLYELFGIDDLGLTDQLQQEFESLSAQQS